MPKEPALSIPSATLPTPAHPQAHPSECKIPSEVAYVFDSWKEGK